MQSQTIKLCKETELTLTMSQSALYVVSKQSILRQIKSREGTELTLTYPPQNARLSRSFSKSVNFDYPSHLFK